MLWLQWLRFLQSWAFHKWCSSLWNQITAIPTLGVVAWLAASSSKPQDFTLRWSRVPGLRTWPSFTNYSANSACDADELNLGPGTLVSAVQIWLWIPHLILHSVLLSQLAKLYRNSTVNSYPVSIMCQLLSTYTHLTFISTPWGSYYYDPHFPDEKNWGTEGLHNLLMMIKPESRAGNSNSRIFIVKFDCSACFTWVN